MLPDSRQGREGGSPAFVTTHWSMIMAAGSHGNPEAEEALEALCRLYWYPLYAYVRRRGHPPENAQDLTQAFFLRLLEKDYIARADHERGRFRTFLLCGMERFLINQHEWSQAARRGGSAKHFSIDTHNAEQQYLAEPMDNLTPERLYEKRWALTVLEQALQALEQEYARTDALELFQRLKSHLGGANDVSYADIGRQLGMSQGSVKTAAFRLRRRFGQALRAEIAKTVEREADIEVELRSLMGLFES